MKLVTLGLLAVFAPLSAMAADVPSAFERWQADPATIFDAGEIDLTEFLWLARPVVVFADTPADPRFAEQIMLLTDRIEDLVDRDVVIITDTDPKAASAIRKDLRPRGFMLTLIAKDGRVNLRKPSPWDVRELSRAIDKMPLRQEELRNQ